MRIRRFVEKNFVGEDADVDARSARWRRPRIKKKGACSVQEKVGKKSERDMAHTPTMSRL
jgi:hypothetical protein